VKHFSYRLLPKIIVTFVTCSTIKSITMWSPSLAGSLLPLFWICSLLRLHLPQHRTSLLSTFPYRFSVFWLTIAVLLLLFLERARAEFLPSLCRAVCNRKSGEPLHPISQGRCPLDFTAVKVIFDTSITVRLRSTPLPIPYKASTYKRLTLPWPWRSVPHRENAAPQGGLVNLPEQPLPIVHL